MENTANEDQTGVWSRSTETILRIPDSVTNDAVVEATVLLIKQLQDVLENMQQANVITTEDTCMDCSSIPYADDIEMDKASTGDMTDRVKLSVRKADEDASTSNSCHSSRSSSSGNKGRLDPNLVQITASNSEIERRLAAFMERKRSEVNENNKREFLSSFSPNTVSDDSCARTDAVFVPRTGGRSHVKVSRVFNPSGPQTQPASASSPRQSAADVNHFTKIKTEPPSPVVDERLRNMESHLCIRSQRGDQITSDVFARLKVLEERILYLESLSPEYFNVLTSNLKRKRLNDRLEQSEMTSDIKSWQQNQQHQLSVEEIESRMTQLKDILRMKATKT